MIYGYAQNGLMDEAMRVFDQIPRRDSISWTTIIAVFCQNGDN